MRESELTSGAWSRLGRRQKLGIIRRQWDPSHPERGEATRGSILEPRVRLSRIARERGGGNGLFLRHGLDIAVVVTDPSVRVPKRFDVFPVVKGLARSVDDPWETIEWVSR